MQPRPEFCVHCGDPAIPGFSLCDDCLLALVKEPDKNDVIFQAYQAAGHAEFEAFLKHHAAFTHWLTQHNR